MCIFLAHLFFFGHFVTFYKDYKQRIFKAYLKHFFWIRRFFNQFFFWKRLHSCLQKKIFGGRKNRKYKFWWNIFVTNFKHISCISSPNSSFWTIDAWKKLEIIIFDNLRTNSQNLVFSPQKSQKTKKVFFSQIHLKIRLNTSSHHNHAKHCTRRVAWVILNQTMNNYFSIISFFHSDAELSKKLLD